MGASQSMHAALLQTVRLQRLEHGVTSGGLHDAHVQLPYASGVLDRI